MAPFLRTVVAARAAKRARSGGWGGGARVGPAHSKRMPRQLSGVTNPEVFTDVEGRRLYRVDFTDLGRETNLLPKIVEAGGVMREAIGTNDGWRCRVRLPDREAFEQVYEFAQSHEIDFTFHRLYEQTGWVEGGPALTDAQRETLIEAVDSGYIGIPRECSLAELGDRLGISETAASERFRRAVKTSSNRLSIGNLL